MSVLIKNMEMPDCCFHCVCSDDGCGITGDTLTTKEMRERPGWCPLEEVQECDDTVSRQSAIDAMCELMHHWFGGDPKDEIREIKRELEKLSSAQTDIAEKLYLYKCYITDKEGLQHEVIYIDDIRRVTGWEI